MRKFLQKDFWFIFCLGIASGLPIALITGTLANRMAHLGIDRSQVGLFALVTLPYSLKFLWAYVVDFASVPVIGRYLGREKSWIMLMSVASGILLYMVGEINPAEETVLLAAICLATGFISATLDIAIDSYRIKLFSSAGNDESEKEQGRMVYASSFYSYGYRVGMLISGACALYLSTFLSWGEVYGLCAPVMLIALFPVFFGSDVKAFAHKTEKSLSKLFTLAVVDPLKSLFLMPSSLFVLLFVLTFKLPDAFLGNMANYFYVDIGFTNAEIAWVIKIYGVAMTLIGTFLGGVLVSYAGYYKSLLLSIILQSLSNLFYLLIVHYGPDVSVLKLVITVENILGGLSGVIMIGYISSLCKLQYSASHYAILSSLAMVGRSFISSTAGIYVDYYGYASLFIFSTLLGILPIILLSKIKKHLQ